MRLHRLTLGLALGALAVTVESRAFAQSEANSADANLERARQLFDAGREAMSESRYDDACRAFEQSLSLARGIGTRFNLADCERHRAHLTRARELFLEVAELARDVGQTERERVARERASAVDAELPRVKLEFEGAPPAIEIDGRKLSAESLREPVALDPGTHRVSASAPGKRSWSKEVALLKPAMFMVLSVPALSDEPPPPNANGAADAASSAIREEPALEQAPSSHYGHGARRAALVLGGIGLGAAIAGAAFGVQFLSNNHDAKAVCPTSYDCSSDDIARHQGFVDDARRARTWSYVGLGVGAAALTGAALLYFSAGRDSSMSATTGVNADGAWNVALRARY